MKKVISLVLALSMLLALAACGKDSGEKNPSAGSSDNSKDTVVVGVTADPETLIPWGKTGTGRQILTWNLYEYLFDMDGFGGEITGILAKGYEKIDPYTFEVEIYDYIYDTEGNHITASDVKFSFDTCIELGASARNKANIESIETADETHVIFHFKTNMDENRSLFEEIMMNTYIVSQAAYEASGDGMAKNAVGTSGYRLKEYVTGSHVTFEKTGKYWQKEELTFENAKATAEAIKYVIIADANQRAIALQSGQVDITSNLSSADLNTFMEGGQYANSFSVVPAPENKTLMMLFNCDETAITNDANLRKALAYCFDSQAVVKNAYSGYAEKVYALQGNTRYVDYPTEWEGREYFDYNLDTAKEYLDAYCKEHGKQPGDITIRILYINESAYEDTATILHQYITQLGVNCELLGRDNNIANDEKFDPSAYEIYIYSYANTVWMTAALNTLLSQTQSLNEGKSMYFIQDPKLQTLLDAAQNVATATEEDVLALDEYINEQCYGVGICREVKYVVRNNRISDVRVDRKCSVIGGTAEY